jgi:two-component system response regulator PilR (NtrC family)
MSEVTPEQPSHSVLVVDDDDAIRLIMTRILARAGFAVTQAADGREAIQKIQHHRFDAILLDLMMPNTDGYEVIAYVKQHHPGQRGVIVVSAAAVRAFDKIDMTVVAATLRKPFDLDALVAAVNACIESREDQCSPLA